MKVEIFWYFTKKKNRVLSDFSVLFLSKSFINYSGLHF